MYDGRLVFSTTTNIIVGKMIFFREFVKLTASPRMI